MSRRWFRMPLFVSLVKGTQKGHETIQDLGKRYDDLKKWVEQSKGKVHAAYATFGRYDYVAVLEFPSEKEAARILARVAARGTANFETMTALPIDEFIKIAREA
jgi:uncharacterized protein with GYD domain